MSKGRALLAPSSASTWVDCPGFAVMAAMIDEPDTQVQLDGRAAHWVAEGYLTDYQSGDSVLEVEEGLLDPDGHMIDRDMIQAAKMYVDEIASVVPDGRWSELRVECRVDTFIHEECYGTPDAVWYDQMTSTLYIWDFKYGHGDVDAFENWQMLCYYDGTMNELMLQDMDLQVEFCVVQPRCYSPRGPVKTWSVPAVELRPYIDRLTSAAIAAMDPAAHTVSGNQCRHCEARFVCESNRQQALAGVSYLNTATPVELTDEAASRELATLRNAIKDLKYREEAIAAEVESRITSGKKIPGFVREAIKGNRKFNAATETLQMLGEGIGVSLIKDPEPVTPAEAERRLKKKGLPNEAIAATLDGLVDRPSSGSRVVMDNGTDARRIFSKM